MIRFSYPSPSRAWLTIGAAKAEPSILSIPNRIIHGRAVIVLDPRIRGGED